MATFFPHVLPVNWDGVVFDRAGIGATSRSSGDAGIWVAMRPSIFLAIATPLAVPRASLGWLSSRIDEGAAIAPAELRLNVSGSLPSALAHEGRHRMTVLRECLGDAVVPVRIAFHDINEADIDDAMLQKVRCGLRSQRGRTKVDGPLFGDAEIDLGGRWISGVPPDHYGVMPIAVLLTDSMFSPTRYALTVTPSAMSSSIMSCKPPSSS